VTIATQTSLPRTEQRVAARRQPTLGTVCHLALAKADGERTGLVWNISPSGVSMLLDEAPAAGTVLPAVLATVDEKRSLPVTLRIIHVREIRTGDYFLGAQFQQPLQPDDMQPFLAEPVAAS
jgi:hypothetical protein